MTGNFSVAANEQIGMLSEKSEAIQLADALATMLRLDDEDRQEMIGRAVILTEERHRRENKNVIA